MSKYFRKFINLTNLHANNKNEQKCNLTKVSIQNFTQYVGRWRTSILTKHKTKKDFNINEQRALFMILVAMSAAVRGTF